MPTIVSDALTTLARVKIFLGLTSDSQDARLIMLINQATGVIKRYTKRNLKSATYTQEEYDGTGEKTLILKQFPVTTLTLLEENNAGDNSDDWETIDAEDYFSYSDGRIILNTGSFVEAPQRYRATYDAGFLIDFDNEEDTSLHTLPFELEYACQKLVSSFLNSGKAEALKSSKVGDITLVFNQSIMNDEELKAILDKYTNFTI